MKSFSRRYGEIAVGVTLLIAVAGCDSSSDASAAKQARTADSGPYTIVTTCGMVTDIVRNVAGDRAKVDGIMGEGVDPHLYKPTRGDVKKLMEADVVFYSGLMLEGRMGDTFSKVARSGKPVFAVTEEIDESFLREPPEFAGHWDPHVWMDVMAWSKAVDFIAESLATYDPAHAEGYRQRAAAFQAELKKLDDYTREVIATVPPAQRYLITAHDAFGYFSRAYDIPVRSVQGISTESEAGVDDINELVDFIVANKVQAVFVESSVSQKSVEAVREGAESKGHEIKIGGQLYSDAMGPASTYEGTYLGMIDHNATTIARALGGEAPEKGLNGKLSLPAPH